MRLTIVVLVGLVACGKAAAPEAAPPKAADAVTTTSSPSSSPEIANGKTLTEFQERRLLGHYSTHDGESGFILDRTSDPWKAKLDGTDKVVTMKVTNTPHPGEKELKSTDGAIWIRVEDSGNVLLFQGPKQHEGVRIVRDASARPLR